MIYGPGVFLLGALCFATTSALPPCVCTRDYTPVCGSDGKTYGNVCQFNCAKSTNNDLTVMKMGRCNGEQKLCICNFNYKPVCGSDGTTYSNKCIMECQPTVRLAYEGQCTEDVKVVELPKCICTEEKEEVCGSDGNTYDNPCLLNCATAKNPSLSIVNSGACNNEVKVVEQPETVKVAEIPSCSCTREKKEVCGSDGNTYVNPCLLNCATAKNPSLSIVSSGACNNEVKVVEQPETVKVAELPSCICTDEKEEVCGSDGNTYDNPCLLNCATAMNPSLSIVNSGACNNEVKVVEQPETVKVAEIPSCSCTREKKEVCGSDGNTYDSPCLFKCATAYKPGVSIASTGPCGTEVKVVEQPADSPACACTRDMRPVCGSDGKTYGNPCMFNCAAKRDPSLTLARHGECSTSSGHSPCACTREFNPVCASDGQTYASICIMRCRNKEAEVVLDGSCNE